MRLPHRRPRAHGPLRSALGAALAGTLLAGLGASCAALDEEVELDARRPIVGDGGRVASVSGNYAYRDDDLQERESFALRASIDEYLADEHVVGAYALGQYTNQQRDNDGREQIWAGVHYHYHLHLDERTSLYAGPSLGVTQFDDENINDFSLTVGVSGGLRHWLSERAAIMIEPTWLHANFDDRSGDVSEEFLVLWGLAFSL